MAEVAARVAAALASADAEAFFDLCTPDLGWGPAGGLAAGCHSRNEALRWYLAARDKGRRAEVSEVCVAPRAIMVGLRVFDLASGQSALDGVDRWQVMAVRDGKIADIRGFELRSEAAAHAGLQG